VINSWSGFRSFNTQASLYNQYVAQSGQADADTFSARPGYSEHQSGLAFDLKDSSGDLYRIDDKTYNYATDWVAQNAHRFGFIVRYLDAWQSITGYHGEPWHLRYIGLDNATKVFDQNVPLETYLNVSGGDYY
jgi:D-alanyl-D-alanine carboxypeptidase